MGKEEREGKAGEGKKGSGGDPRVYLEIFLRITYEICRWRYTKFAKIWASQSQSVERLNGHGSDVAPSKTCGHVRSSTSSRRWR